MNIERLAIDSINPAPYNPRIELRPSDSAYERLKRSITEFDLVEPLVFNRRTGHLVSGHQRLKILKDRGDTCVDAVVVDLPLAREKALNVALNNPNLAGDWDTERLGELLAELKSNADVDVTLTGFTDADLRHLLYEPVQDLAPAEGDDEKEDTRVRVQLFIPPDAWPQVKAALDPLVQQFSLECHIRNVAT